jgi:hypothetical protein
MVAPAGAEKALLWPWSELGWGTGLLREWWACKVGCMRKLILEKF